MKFLGLLGAVLLAGLTACPKHAELKTTDLDQGALHVVLVHGVTPRISRAEAAGDFDRFSDQFATGSVVPLLGTVTTRVSALLGSPPPENLRTTLAWVYITHPDYSSAIMRCPYMPPPSATPPNASNAVVFIVDATTGGAYEYVGSGRRACGVVDVETELRIATMRVSVPWTYRNHVFRVTLPACGSIGRFGAGYVNAIVPFGPCERKGTVFVRHNVEPHMGNQIAPIGVVCGPAFDPVIPRPKSCLNGVAPGGLEFP